MPSRITPNQTRPDLSRETARQELVIGIDEAGRGPWAGPVTVAAVWLNPAFYHNIPANLDDSKKLKPATRADLFAALTTSKHMYSVISLPPAEIDADNILVVTLRAMHDAAHAVASQLCKAGYDAPVYMLVDGSIMPPLPTPEKGMTEMTGEAIIGGDGRSLSIAAASIIAKHTRDAIMVELDAVYPGYGWATNMGYGTKAHRKALEQLGVTPHHRKSYKPVRYILDAQVLDTHTG